jgi:hypothetical protein
MPRRGASAALKQQHFARNGFRLSELDQTDVDILSFTHQVAAHINGKYHSTGNTGQRKVENLPTRPLRAFWCRACRTKGHESPAFSGSCNSRRLRRETKTQRNSRSKHYLQSARKVASIAVADKHLSGISQKPTLPSRNAAHAATRLQPCRRAEDMLPSNRH